MQATVDLVEQKFIHFNTLIFNGFLPSIPIQIIKSAGHLGKFVFKRRPFSGSIAESGLKICINGFLDLDEPVLEDTIIHEMIHFYIYVNRTQDTAPHGIHFKAMMNQINDRYNRHISVSHRYSPVEMQQINGRRKPHLICLVTMRASEQFSEGQKLVKAAPRKYLRIKQLAINLKAAFPVKDMQWFFTYNPFFNRFPVSSAVRLYYVSEEEIRLYLQDAQDVTAKIQKGL